MMKYIPVEGHKNLVRDATTGAIVNINKQSLEDARAAKARRLQEQNRFERLEAEVSEIKALLQLLVKQNG
jgi:hypothetical protein